jgi:hypothetical protein
MVTSNFYFIIIIIIIIIISFITSINPVGVSAGNFKKYFTSVKGLEDSYIHTQKKKSQVY